MDMFSTSFCNPTTTTTTTTSSSSTSSNLNHSLQNMGHPKNVHFLDNSEPLGFPTSLSPPQFCVPPPYYVPPYNQNSEFQNMQMSQTLCGYPKFSFSSGQSGVRIPNHQPQSLFQTREKDRKVEEARTSKIARDKRKQARQMGRSFVAGGPSISEGTISRQHPVTRGESNEQVTDTQNRNTHVFCSPYGKILREILTKKLKNSDVDSFGRIVLPKAAEELIPLDITILQNKRKGMRDPELMLPALRDKEGINVLLKDVYSNMQWRLKYKYWSNNKSRMYILKNTVDFVNHYELRTGDSVTLYDDEFKNLYVFTKKEQNPEELNPSSSINVLQTHGTYNYSYMHTPNHTHQANDEEEEASLALLIKELSHEGGEEAANSLLTMCNDGGYSNGTEYFKIE